jgi:uncharacterized membrane protein YfcA
MPLIDFGPLFLAAGAGVVGGGMNALAGGGTFATLPALIALGLPANIANATSNVALLPGAGASAWAYRDELGPVAGMSIGLLAAVTFVFGLAGSALLILTPTETFDILIPWLLLFAFAVMAFGKSAADWLHARVTIGRPTLLVTQSLLGIYGGYFGGGVGLVLTALYGLLANIRPRELFAVRTVMLAVANLAAAALFVAFSMVSWKACLPMLVGSIIGGWLGAKLGKRMSHRAVRVWTLLVTGATTVVFFVRAYA